ncbi:MAG TPA: tetratricopeptide repeat-containing protein, partial [Anaerolineales bacterium]|nr:tetratricopeptide repeat-containing protein [Anaerolineales bacterium]
GDAFSEAFFFEEAANYYEQAIASGRSTASIKAIERLANFRIRLVIQEYDSNPKKNYKAAKKDIEKQINRLKRLKNAIGETSERLSIVGSGYKRLARISSGVSVKDCTLALKEMENYYNQAWERKEDGHPVAYPLVNALSTTIVQMLRAGVLDRNKLADIKKRIDEAEKLIRKEQMNSPDNFWSAIGVTDIKLLQHLYEYMKGKRKVFSETIHDELVKEYRTAWKQYGSARELNSIVEHYAFLAAVIAKPNEHETVCKVLKEISDSLKSTYEDEVD